LIEYNFFERFFNIFNFFKIVKNLDLLTTNSGNTFDKTIYNTYNLYTEIKNDTLIVNYGDSIQQTFILNSCK
jgi:hypothetical protein